MGQWKTVSEILGFEDLTGYEVSSEGEVKSYKKYKDGRVLKPIRKSDGYLQINLYGGPKQRKMYVHRLVMLAFEFREDHASMTVNHKDFDKTNNTLENLEWLSNAENVRHYKEAVAMTREEADEICKGFEASGMTQEDFAAALGVRRRHLSDILASYTTPGLYTKRVQPSKYSEEERDAIALSYLEGSETQKVIGEQFAVSQTTVGRYVKEFKRKQES